MPRYLIHASPSRMWYVNAFLIPSMVDQGIDRDYISIWIDGNNLGCLRCTMASFASIERNGSGIWHLQDDVAIHPRFKELTEEYDAGLVCGYCYDTGEEKRSKATGLTTTKNIWFSFPCIRIPNGLARDVGEWFHKTVLPDDLFSDLVVTGKHDDTLFVKFVETMRADEFVLHLNPTLVTHIDYLIGGSLINKKREDSMSKELYSENWNKEVVETLKERLAKRYG